MNKVNNKKLHPLMGPVKYYFYRGPITFFMGPRDHNKL